MVSLPLFQQSSKLSFGIHMHSTWSHDSPLKWKGRKKDKTRQLVNHKKELGSGTCPLSEEAAGFLVLISVSVVELTDVLLHIHPIAQSPRCKTFKADHYLPETHAAANGQITELLLLVLAPISAHTEAPSPLHFPFHTLPNSTLSALLIGTLLLKKMNFQLTIKQEYWYLWSTQKLPKILQSMII